MLGPGLETWRAYRRRALLQLNPHVGLSVLIHKLHQLLGIITPDQHHWPRQPQGLLQLQEGKCPQGWLCPDSFPGTFLFLRPAPSSNTPRPGYTCSAAARSSVMSKRTALAPRSPAIRACRDTQQRSRRGQTHSPSTPRPRPLTCLPRILHTPHLCTLPHITHARGRWG